uniref:Uncharacterized protein n=1 Tax=Arundo donax TaxID=35708 RepID=A0A0A9A7H4_ARUDO
MPSCRVGSRNQPIMPDTRRGCIRHTCECDPSPEPRKAPYVAKGTLPSCTHVNVIPSR